jgi:hypothetical protein
MKKLAALMLLICTALFLFPGCGDTKTPPKTEPKTEKPKTT